MTSRPTTFQATSLVFASAIASWGLRDIDAHAQCDFVVESVQTRFSGLDHDIAVSPQHVVAITNNKAARTAKPCTSTPLVVTTLTFFPGTASPQHVRGTLDSEVLWDPQSQRFFATCMDREAPLVDPSGYDSHWLNLACSATSDPFGSWHNWRVQITSGSENAIDQPNIAVADSKVYVNYLRTLNGQDISILHIYDKNSILNGTLPTPFVLNNTSNIESLCRKMEADDGYPQYIVAPPHSTQTSCDSVVLHAIVELTPTPTISSLSLPLASAFHYVKPPPLSEPSGPLSVGGFAEFLGSTYTNGELWAVHHTSTATVGNQLQRCVVQWHRISPNGWPIKMSGVPIESGRFDEGAGYHTYMPSVTTDAIGRIVIVYLRSGATSAIQIRRVVREPGQPNLEAQ